MEVAVEIEEDAEQWAKEVEQQFAHVAENAVVAPRTLSAAERVFGVFELLEAIILRLRFTKSVFSSQRVCKTWYETIKASSYIQTRLCYRQPPWDSVNYQRRGSYNRLALELLKLAGYGLDRQSSRKIGNPPHLEFRRSHARTNYRRLWKLRVVEKKSWEDMYLTSGPCEIVLDEDRTFKGNETTLGELVAYFYEVNEREKRDWEERDARRIWQNIVEEQQKQSKISRRLLNSLERIFKRLKQV